MQPYFFPYLGYFCLARAVESFVFFTDVQYIRRGWINRNRLLDRSSKEGWRYVNVPIQKSPQKTSISEVKIFDTKNWKMDFGRQLQNCYREAPYFSSMREEINLWLSVETDRISTLNIHLLKCLFKKLGINTTLMDSSELEYNRKGNAEEKLMDITKHLNARTYINPAGGTELYSPENWRSKNLTLKFVQMNPLPYSQGEGEFIPHLSILDVLMWQDVETVKNLTRQFTLQ